MTTNQPTKPSNTVINLTTERVIRLDTPNFLNNPLGFTRALPQQIPVVVPAEPDHFKEWLDAEQAKLAECEDFVEYLDRFLEE